jgi:folate-binding Fe-S cluster repair protein YgfZ
MGQIEVQGPGAVAFLQRVTSNDVARLADGQAQYSALPLENGAPVDDVVVLRRAADRFLMVANASNIDKDFNHLRAHRGPDVDLRNRSDEFALLALQERDRPRPLHLDLAHVRDVEQAGGLAHGQVLGDQPGVLDRHLPAREGDHLRAHLAMDRGERSAAQRSRCGFHAGSTSSDRRGGRERSL